MNFPGIAIFNFLSRVLNFIDISFKIFNSTFYLLGPSVWPHCSSLSFWSFNSRRLTTLYMDHKDHYCKEMLTMIQNFQFPLDSFISSISCLPIHTGCYLRHHSHKHLCNFADLSCNFSLQVHFSHISSSHLVLIVPVMNSAASSKFFEVCHVAICWHVHHLEVFPVLNHDMHQTTTQKNETSFPCHWTTRHGSWTLVNEHANITGSRRQIFAWHPPGVGTTAPPAQEVAKKQNLCSETSLPIPWHF